MGATDPAGNVADEAYAAGYRDGCAEAEAKLAAVRALLSLWESWDGSRPHPGESSPRQREQLRLALGTHEDRLRGALGLPALDAIPAESWCCEACRAEGWQCASSCGRPCCVDGGKP